MRNPYPITKSLLALAIVGVSLSACKDDDSEPTPRATLSFEKSTVSAGEGSGVVTVNIVLDRGAAEDMTVSYTLAGTAVDKLTAAGAAADYEIIGDHGEVDIKKGETSGAIEIQIVSDGAYEGNETIDITLDDVDVDNVDIAENNTTKVTILDDEDEGDVVQISFDETSIVTSEDVTELSVVLNLSKPAPERLVLNYTLDGSALDSLFAFENDASFLADYYVVNGEGGEIVIEKGATTATIDLFIYTDIFLEDDETIEISLTSNSVAAAVDQEPVEIQVNQQDGRVIQLEWEDSGADMDLLLWAADPGEDLKRFFSSAFGFTDRPETIIIPDVLELPDADFGVSPIYFSGTDNELNFLVAHATFADGDFLDDVTVKEAKYTLNNINNTWDQQTGGQIPLVAQTFTKRDGVYGNISGITVAGEGSRRTSTKPAPADVRHRSARLQNTVRSFNR
ncbi:hypothetical protein KK062_04985 [Fulvivirgaceae bacterium PWU5]|uniref:Calx-beta domain-containing protein n=1 Tax=Dawidia cretensis TaxID=2782350 RepID=A0AAP2GSU2_9BACT|nr:Calx-beta domain-containing protein [Dawidia cretensis]MBT1707563.1 hypothetical protein [Dawidia cretensis]